MRIWDVRTARVTRVLRGHSAPIIGLVFSPDSSTLASASASEDEEDSSSGELKVWDTQTGRLKRTLYKGSGVYPVIFSPDGQTLVAATGGLYQSSELHFWNARPLNEDRVLELHNRIEFSPEVNAMVFNRNTLIVVSYDDSNDTAFRFLDARSGRFLKIVRDNERSIRNVASSPDNKFLAVATDDNGTEATHIDLRDARTGEILQSASERPKNVFSLAFSKDGLLAAGGENGNISLWRIK